MCGISTAQWGTKGCDMEVVKLASKWSVKCTSDTRSSTGLFPGRDSSGRTDYDRLGKGTFAEVRKAVDIETGDLRAVKQIVKHRFAGDQKTLNLFHREIEITHSLQHVSWHSVIQGSAS